MTQSDNGLSSLSLSLSMDNVRASALFVTKSRTGGVFPPSVTFVSATDKLSLPLRPSIIFKSSIGVLRTGSFLFSSLTLVFLFTLLSLLPFTCTVLLDSPCLEHFVATPFFILLIMFFAAFLTLEFRYFLVIFPCTIFLPIMVFLGRTYFTEVVCQCLLYTVVGISSTDLDVQAHLKFFTNLLFLHSPGAFRKQISQKQLDSRTSIIPGTPVFRTE